MWAGGDYEQIAKRFAPIHDAFVDRLAPCAGERWLDVATGTGEVALRAARAGAEVTGLDLSEGLIGHARAKAASEARAIELVLGDAQALPFGDGSFDVVSSCFGASFAPDQEATAGELARVCRAGGRLGLATWRPKPEIAAIYDPFQEERPVADTDAWGREDRIHELLGGAFELEFEEGVWMMEAETPEALYEWFSQVAPPFQAFLANLDPSRHEEVRGAFVEHWGKYRTEDGVSEPRKYVLTFGTRR